MLVCLSCMNRHWPLGWIRRLMKHTSIGSYSFLFAAIGLTPRNYLSCCCSRSCCCCSPFGSFPHSKKFSPVVIQTWVSTNWAKETLLFKYLKLYIYSKNHAADLGPVLADTCFPNVYGEETSVLSSRTSLASAISLIDIVKLKTKKEKCTNPTFLKMLRWPKMFT